MYWQGRTGVRCGGVGEVFLCQFHKLLIIWRPVISRIVGLVKNCMVCALKVTGDAVFKPHDTAGGRKSEKIPVVVWFVSNFERQIRGCFTTT